MQRLPFLKGNRSLGHQNTGKAKFAELALKDVPEKLKKVAHDDWGHETPAAEVGKIYLVRAIRWRRADTLAVLKVVEKDAFGAGT